MPGKRIPAIQPDQFATFGQLIRFLRQRAGLTQRELSSALGHSESPISRLEKNQPAPYQATLATRLVPALRLEHEPAWAARQLELAEASASWSSVGWTGFHPGVGKGPRPEPRAGGPCGKLRRQPYGLTAHA